MITVLGSINMDLIANVGRLPEPGETVTGDAFATAAGGKGANQALAARRAGARVVMAGAVGDDSFAADAQALLVGAGVDMRQVKTVAGPTGIAVILVSSDGENVIAVIPGANGEVTPDDARAAVGALKAGDILMLQMEIPPASIEAALTEARRKGVVTIANTAPLTADAARLAALADIVIANETEFERLAGKLGLDAAGREAAMRAMHERTGQTLIVTLGGDGVVAIRNKDMLRAKGLVIEPVDTVGAGDTFCGVLAASLDQGHDFSQALRRAAVAGSLACLKHGAQPSIPWAEEVDRALASDTGPAGTRA